MSTKNLYPAHIYDPIRFQIARQLLQKELRKLLPCVPQEAWPAVDRTIAEWAKKPSQYHLEQEQYRDFWDSFAAIMESIKLKPAFTRWLTAENVSWEQKELPLSDLLFTSPIEEAQNIPGLTFTARTRFCDAFEALKDKPELLAERRRIMQEHSFPSAQNEYPIIARKSSEREYKALDGNHRCLKAALNQQETIKAWVATLGGDIPRNYWVPINDLLQLVENYKTAQKRNDEATAKAVRRVLQQQFDLSDCARISFESRLLDQHSGARSLYEESV